MIKKDSLWAAAQEYAEQHGEEAELEERGFEYAADLAREGVLEEKERKGVITETYWVGPEAEPGPDAGSWWILDLDSEEIILVGPCRRKTDALEGIGVESSSKTDTPGLYEVEHPERNGNRVRAVRHEVAVDLGWLTQEGEPAA